MNANVGTTVSAPRLIPVKDAARYLGCTVWAVRELAWGQRIPSIKIGRRLLFDIRDLDIFIEREKIPAI